MAIDCKTKLKELYKELDKEFIDELVDTFDELKARSLEEGTSFQEKAMKAIEKLREDRTKEVNSKVMNLKTQIAAAEFMTQGDFKHAAQGLLAWIEGTNRNVKGGRVSIKNLELSRSTRWAGELKKVLDKYDSFEVAQSGDMDHLIAREVYNLAHYGDKGITSGSQIAYQMGKSFFTINREMHEAVLAAGSQRGTIVDHIGVQTHSAEKIASVDFETWASDLTKLISAESPILREKDVLKAFQDSYKKITSNTYGSAFSFSSAIDRKLARNRSFTFKSPEAFIEYNRKYGSGALYETMLRTIKSTARDLALMEKLGPNPEQGFINLKNIAKGFVKDSSEWSSHENAISHAFEEAIGTTRKHVDNLGAKTGQALRTWQVVTSLGSSVMSSFPDFANAFMIVKSASGRSFFGTAFDFGTTFLDTIVKQDRVKAAEQLGIISDDITKHFYAMIASGNDFKPGFMAKTSNLFFKMNMQEAWTGVIQTSTAKLLNRVMVEESAKPLSKIHGDLLFNLNKYGISGDDLSKISKAVVTYEDGYKYVDIETLIGIDKKLGEKYGTLINDMSLAASVAPGAKTRRILLRGTTQGSWYGETLRAIATFKSFGIEQVNVLDRIARSSPDMSTNYLNMVQTGVAMSFFGAISYWAKQVASNKTPSIPTDPTNPEHREVAKAIIKQGGFGGIAADLLLENYSYDFQKQLTRNLMGPIAGEMLDAGQLTSKMLKGERFDKDLKKMIKSNIPGQNLFYMNAMISYLTPLSLRETLEPGYTSKLMKNMNNKPGLLTEKQKFIMEPPK